MKVTTIPTIGNFKGTILIPIFEYSDHSSLSINYNEFEIPKIIFCGKKDSIYITQKNDNILIFIGLGKTIDYIELKNLFRRVSIRQKEHLVAKVALIVPDQMIDLQFEAIIGGLWLGTYDLGHYKTNKNSHPFSKLDFTLQLVSKVDFTKSTAKAIKIATAQLETLALVDLPPNKITPKYLANWAQNTGNKFGFDVKILGQKEAEKEGLGAFLAVGQGSQHEPQFVIMSYEPKDKSTTTLKHVGLVGKGITFDTGGLNIKTSGMLQMKCDMAGGAAVFGAMQLIADLQLPIKVTAIVPCAENAVDSKSFLPSNVITSYSGKTIEIIDTDAEGRLVLADGLSYLIKNYAPSYIIDIATLTGSAVGTLGHECAALFTNNKEISNKIQLSGDRIGERLWPLPLWDAYKSDIESCIADVKNYSGKPVAGAISAAKFLEYFTNEHMAWAHIDVAGVAFGDDEFAKSKHATAYGVHLLAHFIENL
ncbi:leucyl aminopeptidase family protein [Flavobacterium algicola]|uniref:leucyl aminopeptidase family protein n=1 Tax=Flavobacterium algicola TaxID=556529 RepID=UPI001EFE00EE|nr:leucyl aminopeptidase family protein [Flavobacterium algicola]MCG9792752.1 leucyl aminopeptidase family protein [Flavobacterium algicola]